jgi:arabinoxylan arabinofuranohydrolase
MGGGAVTSTNSGSGGTGINIDGGTLPSNIAGVTTAGPGADGGSSGGRGGRAAGEQAGCGCRLAGQGTPRLPTGLLFVAAVVLGLLRRRSSL